MTEDEALIALNAVPGVGSARLRKLVRCFGSALAALKASPRSLEELAGIPDSVVEHLRADDHGAFIKSEQQRMIRSGAGVVNYRQENYPAMLKEIPDAPPVLYYWGDLTAAAQQSVAIVGTRQPSFYGVEVAEKFALRLAELGIVVVSGMARGIDTAAHRGALKAGGLTVAVLGCGLEHVYPQENGDLRERISRQGVVLSEFSMSTPPMPNHFPRRNRIISGLSLGVVVVEAALKSGALITCDFALQQGREVFAVPGRVDSPMARGVNQLIQQGAKLVGCVEDILEELVVPLKASTVDSLPVNPQSAVEEPLLEEESQVIAQMSLDPVHMDELSERCSLSFPALAGALFSLELKKAIRQLPGKYFVRRLKTRI